MVKIFVGINGKELTSAIKDASMMHKPARVWIREGWAYMETQTPDMSLIRTQRKIVFIPEVVAPVCLIGPADFDEFVKKPRTQPLGFVSGWGAQFMQCDSNDLGPAPNTMCKFPYIDGEGREHRFCSMGPTPSASNPVCRDFFEWSARNNIKVSQHLGDTVMIRLWDDRRQYSRNKVTTVKCYSDKPGSRGWCGTCYPNNERPGTEGYCDVYDSTTISEDRREFSLPTSDRNWGWCADWCKPNKKQTGSQYLQETEMDLLNDRQCDILGYTINANVSYELCAGKKQVFPKVQVFNRLENRQRPGNFRYEPDGFETDFKGTEGKFDFYLGGQDSCQGDSGGPLIVYLPYRGKLRAFTIGVVSRGAGCANFNQPGVFSKVSAHLDWIYSKAGHGKCSSGRKHHRADVRPLNSQLRTNATI